MYGVLVQAAITKPHRLCALNDIHLRVTVLEATKSKIKVLVDLMLGERLKMSLLCLDMVEKERTNSFVYSLAPIPSLEFHPHDVI